MVRKKVDANDKKHSFEIFKKYNTHERKDGKIKQVEKQR